MLLLRRFLDFWKPKVINKMWDRIKKNYDLPDTPDVATDLDELEKEIKK